MRPFQRKSFTPFESLPAEDTWQVGRGTRDGKEMIIRLNETAKTYAGHPELPMRMGVAIPLLAPDARGFPAGAESTQLVEIEDRLFSLIGSMGRVVVIITHGGMREFVCYVRSTSAAETVVAKLRTLTPTHEVQSYVENDAGWIVYDEFSS
jgi:hypothetical protein